MRKIKTILALVAVVTIIYSCEKDHLDRQPLDQVGSDMFFRTPSDLATYVNQFYRSTYFPIAPEHGLDYDSDLAQDVNVNTWLQGARTLDGAGAIGFGDVRNINYFFDNYERLEDEGYDFEDYKQYVGEAHFFKALIYFGLLERYGDIPWLDKVLSTDSPELYKPRDPREVVADNIIASLDTAVAYLQEDKTDGSSRINKWMALLIQSRVALFEGTWQKYHAGTPFGADNPNPEKYLTKAAAAAYEIMENGPYSLYSTGDPNSDYYHLFAQRDYSANEEVMFWKKFDNGLGAGEAPFRRQPNYMQQFPYEHSISKYLADSYLSSDGDPISVSPLFGGYETYEDEYTNRDPRFHQTIAVPESVWRISPDGDEELYSELFALLNTGSMYNSPGAYVIRKGYDARVIYHTPQYEETPGIIYRYGEVLLNYAEAKAELGSITQTDLDQSINLLRDRVGMPHLILGNITHDPNWDFPDLTPIINEIRRERLVELALEGFRAMDIKRWAAADELIVGQRPRGRYAEQLPINSYPVDEEGFIDAYQNQIPNGYGFILNRDYLDPIPKDQIELNPDLTQNPGWE